MDPAKGETNVTAGKALSRTVRRIENTTVRRAVLATVVGVLVLGIALVALIAATFKVFARQGGDVLTAIADTDFKMTEFGITPPNASITRVEDNVHMQDADRQTAEIVTSRGQETERQRLLRPR